MPPPTRQSPAVFLVLKSFPSTTDQPKSLVFLRQKHLRRLEMPWTQAPAVSSWPPEAGNKSQVCLFCGKIRSTNLYKNGARAQERPQHCSQPFPIGVTRSHSARSVFPILLPTRASSLVLRPVSALGHRTQVLEAAAVG